MAEGHGGGALAAQVAALLQEAAGVAQTGPLADVYADEGSAVLLWGGYLMGWPSSVAPWFFSA